jgi:DNA-binding NarL/FixJ family response regulator
MSKMKDLALEVSELYRQGYTILAIARQLNLSTTEVQSVVNQTKGESK